MNNRLKKIVLFLAFGTFAVGIATSMSSFGTAAVSAPVPTPCFDVKNTPDCPPSTSYTLTINGTSADNYSITSGTTGGTLTVTILGQTLSFPKKTGTGSSTVTGSNGSSYTLSQTVVSNFEIYCNTRTSVGGYACTQVDCKGDKVQTYSCATPGLGTGTSTGSSTTSASLVW